MAKTEKENKFKAHVLDLYSRIQSKYESKSNNFRESTQSNNDWHRGYAVGYQDCLNYMVFLIGNILEYDVRPDMEMPEGAKNIVYGGTSSTKPEDIEDITERHDTLYRPKYVFKRDPD